MCVLKAFALRPRAARSSDMWATHDRMLKCAPFSHGRFPRPWFECPKNCFVYSLTCYPSLPWIAHGNSQRKEKPITYRSNSPLEQSIVSLSIQKSRCRELHVTRSRRAWNLVVYLLAPSSFLQGLSRFRKLVFTEKWQCPKSHWKSRRKLLNFWWSSWTWCFVWGLAVDHVRT